MSEDPAPYGQPRATPSFDDLVAELKVELRVQGPLGPRGRASLLVERWVERLSFSIGDMGNSAPSPPAPPAPGLVSLVGAGPGDPGLLTLRARERLAACEVLVHDALVTAPILALCHPAAERIAVGKRGGRPSAAQAEINALLEAKAQAGRRVVRLKGGDPYLFGRGAEEALYLAERGIAVEVVPGVTAGIAATICAGVPLTHRAHASAVAFVTGHEDPAKSGSALDWAALAKIGTLCFYMGVRNLERIAARLAQHLPPSTPVAVIQWGATPRQRTVGGTLADIAARVREAKLQAPAITVVGAVAALRERLAFFERRPLFGKRIVVTRARAQASALAARLDELGAETLLFPTIRIEPGPERRSLAAAVAHLDAFDWVVLTSVNGVDALFEELRRQGRDARAFGKAKVAAIGPATAARLAERGIRADLVPPKYVAEEIVASLERAGLFAESAPDSEGKRAKRPEHFAGSEPRMALEESSGPAGTKRSHPRSRPLRFLLARADIARRALPERLRELGAGVTEVIAYRTVLETEGQDETLAALERGEVDAVTFASSSTARNFARLLGPERLKAALASPRLKCLSIGPVTSATLRELSIPVHGEAAEHDIPGLVRLLQEAL